MVIGRISRHDSAVKPTSVQCSAVQCICFSCLLPHPQKRCEVPLWVCLFVCLSVRSHISWTLRPNLTKLYVHVDCDHGSGGVAIRYIRPSVQFCVWCHVLRNGTYGAWCVRLL